jgi:heme/copper-type cytochrome/quinol oxidase subunit 3
MEVSYLLISFLHHWISQFHVLSEVIINIIISLMFLLEHMKKEKLRDGRESWFILALVDLVWVFVFTVFYLV